MTRRTEAPAAEADTNRRRVDGPGRRDPALAPDVRRLLAEPLDPALVSHRIGAGGRRVPYLEGHRVIDQANRIFGYGTWGAELVGPVQYRPLVRAGRGGGRDTQVGMYWAAVQVQVSGCTPRSDVGCAFAEEDTPEAHETALKGAVTDAIKRACRQFGEQFGLGLASQEDGGRGSAVEDLRAAVITLGAGLGLDDAAVRQQAGRKAGKPFERLDDRDLARVIRAMAEASRRRRAA